MAIRTAAVTVLAEDAWRDLADRHSAEVDRATLGRRQRRAAGRSHPVDDFLFEYYNFRPAQLARWHPGPGVALHAAAERAGWAFYSWDGESALMDVGEFVHRRAAAIEFVTALLAATLSRPPRLGCFGLHEWAMVYRAGEEEIRHAGWPLRLGRAGTDQVVQGAQIACSHFDAYRFFTQDARPRNTLTPTRDRQLELEQPGCLHAGMDVYKWCFKLTPLVPSELTLRAFHLAREIRTLDMRAAPYDLRELGLEPVPIETPEGRSEYVRQQRAFTERSNHLRRELLELLRSAQANW